MAGMRNNGDSDVRQARLAAVVIAATAILWVLSLSVGPMVGIDARYGLLIDLAAAAAFIWSLAVVFRVWRRRQRDGER